jgi:YggT family protein
MAVLLSSVMMFALCLLSLLSTGSSFQLNPTPSIQSKISLRNAQIRMVNSPASPIIQKQLNQQILLLSVATAAVCLVPGVAEATDGSMAIAKIISPVLDAFIFAMNFLFVCRTVISWYPKTDLTILPFSAIVWPTEPLLVPVRELVPPAFGVDVSAIVWISLLSFLHEILTGQQGILTLLEKT